MPAALVTTPESLSLMLTRERAAQDLAGVHTVIVDEWHELIGNKRGVQVQLALARLKRWNPKLAVWGLSATLGNLGDAMRTLCGDEATLVQGRSDKRIVIDTLLLAAGVSLWALLQLNPLRDHWLGAKLALLVLYIVLGSWALRRAGTTAARAAFLVAALTVLATMVSIGWTRHPLGIAMLATRTDLRATGHRVPGRVGPFD